MTKRKVVKGYLAIEEDGVEVWPKDLVKAVYLACSEEIQALKKKGAATVTKLIPVRRCSRYVAVSLMSRCQKCDRCRMKEQPCKLSSGARSDGMICTSCNSKNRCSRPADYMWMTFGATWMKQYSITQKQFRKWYPKVMALRSIYVIKDGDGSKSELKVPKGGKPVKKNEDRGDNSEIVEDDEDEDEDEDKDKEGEKGKEKEGEKEGDEQGDDQDPSPSTSRGCTQGGSRAASTPNQRPWSQDDTRTKQELEMVKAQLRDCIVDRDLYRDLCRTKTTLSIQTELESDNERLRTRLLEFEKIVCEFMEEKQTGAPDMMRFREGCTGEFLFAHSCLLFTLRIELYTAVNLLHGQNEEFREHLNRLMSEILVLKLRLDVEGDRELPLWKNVSKKLHEMAVGVYNLPGSVWTTMEKERIEKIFNNKRSGGDLEEDESRRKRARMLLESKEVDS